MYKFFLSFFLSMFAWVVFSFPSVSAVNYSDISYVATGTIAPRLIANIVSKGYFSGSVNARYLILRYTDPLCPYCRKEAKTWNNTEFSFLTGGIRMSIRQFPLIQIHPDSFYYSSLILCSWKLGWVKAYNAVNSYITTNDSVVQNEKPSIHGFSDILRMYSLREFELRKCMMNKNVILKQISATKFETKLFSVYWVPSTVVIDTKTNRFTRFLGTPDTTSSSYFQ